MYTFPASIAGSRSIVIVTVAIAVCLAISGDGVIAQASPSPVKRDEPVRKFLLLDVGAQIEALTQQRLHHASHLPMTDRLAARRSD
jgi:hypothetical protein